MSGTVDSIRFIEEFANMAMNNTVDLDHVPQFVKELRHLSDKVEAIYLSDVEVSEKQAQISELIGDAV